MVRALSDHALDKGGFTALAPELRALAAEVQNGFWGFGGAGTARSAEVSELSQGAGGGFGRRGVEGRIADREGEALAGAHDVLEEVSRRGLEAALDVGGDGGIGRGELVGPFDRSGVDVRADEAPAVLTRADQRIDAVGTDADIEDGYDGAAQEVVVVIGGEQVCDVVQVVGAAGNGRTEVAAWNVPMRETIVVFEQGAVERGDGVRFGKVDGVTAERMRYEEALQFRRAPHETREIVRRAVVIARVEFAGGVIRFFRDGFQDGWSSEKRGRGQGCCTQGAIERGQGRRSRMRQTLIGGRVAGASRRLSKLVFGARDYRKAPRTALNVELRKAVTEGAEIFWWVA